MTWTKFANLGIAALLAFSPISELGLKPGVRDLEKSQELEGSAKILVYADDPVHQPPNTYIDQALDLLNLEYSAAYNGDWEGFTSALVEDGPWDLVLVGDDEIPPDTESLDALLAYLENDGKLIIHSLAVGSTHTHILWARLGFTWLADDTGDADPVYWWQPGMPPFAYPDQLPPFTLPTQGRCTICGQRVERLADNWEATGYAPEDQTSGQAAMVVDEDLKTIFKGFLDQQFDGDLDGDGVTDGVELWKNMIFWLLHPDGWSVILGTVYGLGYCDQGQTPLPHAAILIDDGLNEWALKANLQGYFQWWGRDQSGLTLLFKSTGYESIYYGIPIYFGYWMGINVYLSAEIPCLRSDIGSLHTLLEPGEQSSQILYLQNNGGKAAEWQLVESAAATSISADIPWLSVAPISGTVHSHYNQSVVISFNNQSEMAPGIYTSTLTLLSDDPEQPEQQIEVSLLVGENFRLLPQILNLP